MPAGDGTGPMGVGPMSGRGMGYCAGFSAPGYMNPAPGQGMGYRRGWNQGGGGRGRGRGWRRGGFNMGTPMSQGGFSAAPANPPMSGDYEMQVLQAQAGHLEGALDEIRKRIEELEKNVNKDK